MQQTTHRTRGSPVEILLVEDNLGDQTLTREALREGRISNELSIVDDGVEALRFLRREGGYDDAPRPDMILLDLNLPRMTGHEVLTEIKKDPALRTIPVVVLTTSASDEDILTSYELHANAYITKPVDLDQFMRAVRAVGESYLTIVKLPPGPTRA